MVHYKNQHQWKRDVDVVSYKWILVKFREKALKTKEYFFKYKNLDFRCIHYDTEEITFWYGFENVDENQKTMLLFFNVKKLYLKTKSYLIGL